MIMFLLGITLIVIGVIVLAIYCILDNFDVFDFPINADDICARIVATIIIIGVILCTIGVIIGIWHIGLGFASLFN